MPTERRLHDVGNRPFREGKRRLFEGLDHHAPREETEILLSGALRDLLDGFLPRERVGEELGAEIEKGWDGVGRCVPFAVEDDVPSMDALGRDEGFRVRLKVLPRLCDGGGRDALKDALRECLNGTLRFGGILLQDYPLAEILCSPVAQLRLVWLFAVLASVGFIGGAQTRHFLVDRLGGWLGVAHSPS